MYAGVTLAIFLMLQVPNKQLAVDTLNIAEISVLEQTTVKSINKNENTLNSAEFDLLARCVEAEAGDQDFKGVCFAVDVILNRAEQWGLTITEVINQKTPSGKHWQFEVVENGRINKVTPSEKTIKAVKQELQERLNTDILYFCMYDWFSGWATFCFKHGGHYFYK